MLIPSLLQSALDRLLPGCCALCGGDGPGPMCADCSARWLPEAGAQRAATPAAAADPRCTCCAIRLPSAPNGNLCDACTQAPPSFDRTVVLADYAPPLDSLLLALKFRACLPLARALGSLLARKVMMTHAAETGDALRDIAPSGPAPVLLPVPLSRERLAERGFNQAHEIARPLARALQLPLASGLCVRVRHTDAQASLPLAERRVNMRSAFAVPRPQAIVGQALFVVDDVMTTGHTLEALAACLKRHGATHVTNLVIARTPAR